MRPATQRGISLVESVISMLLVTMVIGSTLATVGPVVEGSTHAERAMHAARLGDELLSEILSTNYEDPDDETKAIGTDPGETYGDRAAYDDVDDYAGYLASPAVGRDGTKRAGSAGFTQYADVDWIDPLTLKTSSVETGLKSVRIVIYYDSTILYRAWSVVSEDDPRGGG